MNTKEVTCRYFMHGICREGSKCLFSHDLSASKPSIICKFYQKGFCAYGTRCRYDHTKPSTSAGGAAGPRPAVSIPSPALPNRPPPQPGFTATIMKSKLCESGKREKRPLVLRDRNLSGLTDIRPPADPAERPGCYSDGRGGDLGGKPHSYLEAICSGLDNVEAGNTDGQQLCPYAMAGGCRFGNTCGYLHGEVCEICGLPALHPLDVEQRRTHEKVCMDNFEHDMEKAFAFQASQGKTCSICMEVIYDKPSASERRFGILSNCNHTYCLGCIRQWRCAKQFENPIIKKKACKYFDQGNGTCPFGGKCLYLHAYPDGTRAEPEKPRKQLGREGGVRFFNSVRLWDFIEDRESRHLPQDQDDDVLELGDLFMHLSGAEAAHH
ncbi:probable E3 ubiquitin-protein ligase makorin-2 isoform X2 [Tachyglossus aculeatus]|uniref:probable E3 ubiquitin-protein ligase makorin-2 isoform X2 n=1 Tax=Tachyglossus aculeatus TaxID=9261 RepID=UPI0018F4DDF0|nr:probable E3 ubiquitin-protein ligase makorin-2 isoform X2 [Tachyglossus aculeatus]